MKYKNVILAALKKHDPTVREIKFTCLYKEDLYNYLQNVGEYEFLWGNLVFDWWHSGDSDDSYELLISVPFKIYQKDIKIVFEQDAMLFDLDDFEHEKNFVYGEKDDFVKITPIPDFNLIIDKLEACQKGKIENFKKVAKTIFEMAFNLKNQEYFDF